MVLLIDINSTPPEEEDDVGRVLDLNFSPHTPQEQEQAAQSGHIPDEQEQEQAAELEQNPEQEQEQAAELDQNPEEERNLQRHRKDVPERSKFASYIALKALGKDRPVVKADKENVAQLLGISLRSVEKTWKKAMDQEARNEVADFSNNLYVTLQSVLVQIMKNQGGNTYKLIHMGKDKLIKEGNLPDTLEVYSELYEETLKLIEEYEKQLKEEEEKKIKATQAKKASKRKGRSQLIVDDDLVITGKKYGTWLEDPSSIVRPKRRVKIKKLDLIRERQVSEFEVAIQEEKPEEEKRKGKQPIIEEKPEEKKPWIPRPHRLVLALQPWPCMRRPWNFCAMALQPEEDWRAATADPPLPMTLLARRRGAGKKNGFWIQNSDLGGAWARVCGGDADQSFQSTG
ncbi:hypothetical protein ACQ4PT_061314 [Festuca glaucescens]